MARKNKDQIFVKVMQNGSEIANTEWPVKKPKTIELSSSGHGMLSLPLYPLAENIRILKVQKQKTILTLDQPWSGYLSSNGLEVWLKDHDRSEKQYEMQPGDYANLTLGDLRLMIKICKPVTALLPPLNPVYKGNLSQLMFHNKLESTALMSGLLLTVAWFGLFIGLIFFLSAPPPKSFEELEDTYTLPFIHEASLRTAPEALQANLDRKNLLGSVIRFYRNTSLLFMGWKRQDDFSLFPSSISMYQSLYQDHQEALDLQVQKQSKLNLFQKQSDENSVVNIPSVYGESFRQRLFRITHKIENLHEGFDLALDLRRKTSSQFKGIPDYRWGEYHVKDSSIVSMDKVKGMQGGEELAKISVFSQKTNEEVMYGSAKLIAEKAAQIQTYLKRRSEPGVQLSASNISEIVIPSGITFASFVHPDTLASNPDIRLESLEGMNINTQSQKLKEPVTGTVNPRLIERIVKKHRFQLNLCYELALRRNQNLRGKMHLNWKIDSRGQVYDISLQRTTLSDRQMINCIRRKLASWKFPRPGKGSVKINHSFEFEPQGG